MRRTILAVVCAVLVAAPAGAQDVTTAVDPRSVADRVVAFADKGATDDLVRIATTHVPDPWLVADELCARGKFDVAATFAGCTDAPTVAGLAGYVKSQREHPTAPERRKALADSSKAAQRRDLDGALGVVDAASLEPQDVLSVRLVHQRANILGAKKDLEGARAAFTQARERAEQMGWTLRAANLSVSIGLACRAMKDHAAGVAAWEQARDGFETVGYTRQRALACEQLGRANEARRHYRSAATAYETARGLYEQLGMKLGVANSLSRLAKVRYLIADYAGSLIAHEEALELFTTLGDSRGVAKTCQNLGMIHWRLLDGPRAIDVLRRARMLYTKIGESDALARVNLALARIHQDTGALSEASSYLDDAESSARSQDLRAKASGARARQMRLEGDLAGAAEIYERTRALAKKRGDVRTIAVASIELCSYPPAGLGPKGVLDLAKTAARDAEDAREPVLLAHAYALLAGQLHIVGDDRGAIAAARRSVSTTASLGAGLSLDEVSRARAALRPFESGIASAVRLGDVEELWYFIEANRGHAIRESVGGRDGLRGASQPAFAERRREAKRVLELAERELAAARDDGSLARVRASREAMEKAERAFQRVAESADRWRRRAVASDRVDPVGLDEFQGQLDNRTVHISYETVDRSLVALVVTSDTARIVRLGGVKTTSEALEWANPLSEKADSERARNALAGPLTLEEDIRLVLITPNPEVTFVSFALLFPDRKVALVPSASILVALRETAGPRGEDVLAYGDPAYSTEPKATGVVAMRAGLAALPASGEEAKAVGTVVRLREQASETALRRDLAGAHRWRSIHLACHGLVHPTNPVFSAVALAPSTDDDGLVTVVELIGINVAADLVVVSACESGRGLIRGREGSVGLASAFMAAGAPRVIVSLWKVDDAATAHLMKAFYSHWEKRGETAAVALRAAQDEVRTVKKWEHPRYWAAWVLWGLPD